MCVCVCVCVCVCARRVSDGSLGKSQCRDLSFGFRGFRAWIFGIFGSGRGNRSLTSWSLWKWSLTKLCPVRLQANGSIDMSDVPICAQLSMYHLCNYFRSIRQESSTGLRADTNRTERLLANNVRTCRKCDLHMHERIIHPMAQQGFCTVCQ